MLEIIFVCEINLLGLESTDIFTKMQLFSSDFCSISAQRGLLSQAGCTCERTDASKELEGLHSDRWPRKPYCHNQRYGNAHQQKQNKQRKCSVPNFGLRHICEYPVQCFCSCVTETSRSLFFYLNS